MGGNEVVRRSAGAVLLLLALSGAASVNGQGLPEVFDIAKTNDPRYRAARFDFKAATYAEPQALAALLPNISFEAANTETDQKIISSRNPVFASGVSNYPTSSRTLSLTQPIFKLPAWVGYKQAKAKVRQAASTFAAAEQDLILRVAIAYLNVLAASDALEFAGAERDAIRRQLDLVQQRYKSGLVAVAGLHDARARHAIKEADVVGAQNELDDRVQALQEITGKVFTRLKPLRETIPLELPDPPNMEHWVEAAQRQNLLLEARRQGVEVAQQEVERQRAAHFPVLDLVANHNRKDTGGSLFGGGSDVETLDVMLRLNIPLFSGGLTSALTGEAVQRHHSSKEDLERDLRQVERQTRAAFQGITGGAVRVKALAQSVVSSESARELKTAGFKAGLETLLQVLDAERDLYAAKRDSAKARYDFLLNRLRLKMAVGTLNEADLTAIGTLMQ